MNSRLKSTKKGELRDEFEPRATSEKFTMGFCGFFMIALLILLPIILFSDLTPSYIYNPTIASSLVLSFQIGNSSSPHEIYRSAAYKIRSLNEE